MGRIAITGAGGFIGTLLVRRAVESGLEVRPLVRSRGASEPASAQEGTDFESMDELCRRFEGCEAVVNLAARVHVTRETAADLAGEFLRVNRDLAVRLASAAKKAGVPRFVQMSSVAAVCSTTPAGVVVDDSSPELPQNAYGKSKLAADRELAALRDGSFSVASLRPPTVYGPGVRAYFRQIMRAARLGIPLPIGSIDNRRSFMFIGNLVSATLAALKQPTDGTFIVTDSEPMSTAQLYREMLRIYGRPAWVPSLSPALVHGAASSILGKRADSLLASAAYDGARFRKTFGWEPATAMPAALSATLEGRA